MAVNCPECDAVLDVEEEDLDVGDALTCEECGATVAVTSKEPLELAASDEDEDEDDDEFDEDDDDDLDDEEEEEDEEDDAWH